MRPACFTLERIIAYSSLQTLTKAAGFLQAREASIMPSVSGEAKEAQALRLSQKIALTASSPALNKPVIKHPFWNWLIAPNIK